MTNNTFVFNAPVNNQGSSFGGPVQNASNQQLNDLSGGLQAFREHLLALNVGTASSPVKEEAVAATTAAIAEPSKDSLSRVAAAVQKLATVSQAGHNIAKSFAGIAELASKAGINF